MKTKESLYQKCYRWLLQSVQFQLYLTYVSWPFLLWWGIPLSLATAVGNLIFAPFLIVFLLLSIFIFFSSLVGISCAWCITLRNYLSGLWLYLAAKLPCSMLITFARPAWWILPLFPCIATALIMHPVLGKPQRSIVCFFLLFVGSGIFLTIKAPHTTVLTLKNNITLLHHAGHTTLVIGGSSPATRTPSLPWITYTLVPTLITLTGKQTIDTVILCSCTPAISNFIEQLTATIPITKVFTPNIAMFKNHQENQNLAVVCVTQRTKVHTNKSTHFTLTKIDNSHLHLTGFCGKEAVHRGCKLK